MSGTSSRPAPRALRLWQLLLLADQDLLVRNSEETAALRLSP